MKKVVFSLLAVAFVTVFVSCKNETKDPSTEIPADDLAIADTTEPTSEFLYVTANSGLSLREFNNLNSEKLAVMPYGTKVKIVKAEAQPTMTVGGIKGAMDEVEFNHKKGFAFNGYLSKFFPPEQDISAKSYAEELQKTFPKVSFSETTGGTASKPSNTEILLLPTTQWHEAFFVAQQLFDFPKEFAFPEPKGKDEQIIKDSKPKKDVWESELHVNRKDDVLQKIAYVYKTKTFSNTITITKDGEAMKIERTEVVE
ncbi:hypothetical protein ATE92_1161 [Ulvibacter sp. MAR_2010_11]|uniref:SH3 domain-containing protein n=1 Tax=Ulvibacter sp. MAR_2010_11 TaxID=1250229 RepID=UPI000C2B8EFB|nr:SH3 domain-containing protein [Ulvibacter sp. MAR_2010_11]PKA83015.1 hypothetical protein ATE92_1161 [Ulvibacter sp. MAR_2010_11]